jgi:hypothetical protein
MVSEKKDWTASARAQNRGLRQLFLQVPASSNLRPSSLEIRDFRTTEF